MANPKNDNEKRKRVDVTLSQTAIKWLEDYSKETGTNKSQLVESLIQDKRKNEDRKKKRTELEQKRLELERKRLEQEQTEKKPKRTRAKKSEGK